MRQGLRAETPLPTRLVSNEEFPPLPQTPAQRRVEDQILAEAARLAPRLGLSRRDFLRGSGGDGRVAAGDERGLRPVLRRAADRGRRPGRIQGAERRPRSSSSTCSCTTWARATIPHNEEAGRAGAVSKQALLGLRQGSRRLNPKLAADRGTMADLAWANMVKEVFLDSETDIGLISTPPGPVSPGGGGAAEGDDAHPRRDQPGDPVAADARPRAHHPAARPGRPRLHGPAGGDPQGRRVEGLHRRRAQGLRPRLVRDDEKIAYPMLERARKLGIKRVCLHKGLPLGPVADYNHPRDVIKAAQRLPRHRLRALPRRAARRCRAPSRRRRAVDHRVLPDEEEGAGAPQHLHGARARPSASSSPPTPPRARTCWARSSTPSGPTTCCGAPTRSGTARPQWQIEAFRRFEIPQALVDAHGYAPLTRQVKEQIFGLNAARLFGVDVQRQAQRAAQGLPEPDQDGLPRRGPDPEPPLLRLDRQLRAGSHSGNVGM